MSKTPHEAKPNRGAQRHRERSQSGSGANREPKPIGMGIRVSCGVVGTKASSRPSLVRYLRTPCSALGGLNVPVTLSASHPFYYQNANYDVVEIWVKERSLQLEFMPHQLHFIADSPSSAFASEGFVMAYIPFMTPKTTSFISHGLASIRSDKKAFSTFCSPGGPEDPDDD